MQSDPPSNAQWAGGSTPGEQPVMSATSGPIEPHEYYWPSAETPSPSPYAAAFPAASLQPPPEAGRSISQSTGRQPLRSPNNLAPPQTLNSAKSTPVLVPSRSPGNVKSMATRFDQAGVSQPNLTVRTGNPDKYRRAGVSKGAQHVSPRSPTKDGMTKLQKRRPGQPRSPAKSPSTSFENSSGSFSSTGTLLSTRSQPHAAFNPKKQQDFVEYLNQAAPYGAPRPLFGEITSDGRWNGNFELGDPPPIPTYNQAKRRSSDGNLALGHGRSQSHQDILQPASADQLSAPPLPTLNHKRSRSDMDAIQPQGNRQQQTLNTYPTPPPSGGRNVVRKEMPASRIPVAHRPQASDPSPPGYPRSTSAQAFASPTRNRLSKSPPRRKDGTVVPENAKPGIGRNRYNPAPITIEPSSQTLSAKIVPPLPKTSPPLRSSRPRQPVSSATTSASRARAAGLQSPETPRDGRRPSEQWLGKPYDPQQERSKRKIPELGKINFEERRARIQKAISQNLEESRSQESLRARNASRQASLDVNAGAEIEARDMAEQHQKEVVNDSSTMPGGWPTPGQLSVDTFKAAELPPAEQGLRSDGTEFEVEESPILGRPAAQQPNELLTPATYQPPAAKASFSAPPPISITHDAPMEEVQSPSVLENVMAMRQRSPSNQSCSEPDGPESSGHADVDESPSGIEQRWDLDHDDLMSIQGSIRIMLDGGPNPVLPRGFDQRYDDDAAYVQQNHQRTYSGNHHAYGHMQEPESYADDAPDATPRNDKMREGPGFQPAVGFAARSDSVSSEHAIARVLEHYQRSGSITAEMVETMKNHMVDLQRVSANAGSNGFMIQSLLESVINSQYDQGEPQQEEQESRQLAAPSSRYEMPVVTPDTPKGWEFEEQHGTAIVYNAAGEVQSPAAPKREGTDEEDFHVKIRRADEIWAREQRGEYLRLSEDEDNGKPAPPPKDAGYTPRHSTGLDQDLFRDFSQGLRISTLNPAEFSQSQSAGANAVSEVPDVAIAAPRSAPPQPHYAPPPAPASLSASRLPLEVPEVPQIPATYSERGSSELKRNAYNRDASGSSRPSVDSDRAQGRPPGPDSTSESSWQDLSFADSATLVANSKKNSMDPNATKSTSESAEQKRLMKRRHIIRELLDTENSYHQDLKIIEDIYKATALPDLISPEDKKILFGNCDEIERFSLHFYDEMRKAVVSVYTPAKDKRWQNKRNSFSTTQSDGTGQGSVTPEAVDDEKDRTTTVGYAFLQNLQQMEHVYSFYLKNHDVANQRLAALRSTHTVKCWLDECQKNASDITTAWDLDSLLVKPTQRVAKYPMLLSSLLETTPQDHPDRESIRMAADNSVSMLMRINEAKKRADLVDQIVNRKRKDSDMRSGIAKAFGRRTEKLKERVGIAEAFQDQDFDELAHKFGGHFIRLQICMRDVQDYMNRIDKAITQIDNYAGALDLFTDVGMSSGSEQESKWRKYGLAIRELTSVAFTEHKNAVNKRVIGPMVACIKLHEGPQKAIHDRKKRIVDYAKCKAIEKRGEKPDKKTVEASDLYIALNDQLKIELPKLYTLTAQLVQGCLSCFLEIQLTWYNTWERKLKPVLEAADIPVSIQQIEPAFRADYDLVKNNLEQLGICNGAVLAETANFLSPTTTHDERPSTEFKRPATLDSSKRAMSIGSDVSPVPGSSAHKRRSSGYAAAAEVLAFPYDNRIRSNSSMSTRGTPIQTPGSAISVNRPWTNGTTTPVNSRPATANPPPPSASASYLPPRTSAEHARSPRPMSGATYFTARPEQPEDHRFSNIFSSAMPDDTPDSARAASPRPAPDDTPVLFVCASLFEFSIDKTRREGGYPYLTYVQGEVFDVIAQKGELWLAKNQDDSGNTLGWIWEQHFVILSQD